MASMIMTASLLAGATSTVTKQHPSSSVRRGLVVAKASEREKTNLEFNNSKEERSSSGRRDLVFAAAAFSVAQVALADEPKKGTPEF